MKLTDKEIQDFLIKMIAPIEIRSRLNVADEVVSIVTELLELREENQRLREAISVLSRETKGTLKAHEIAIRYDHGNSNWRCLEIALELAEKALKGGEK